MATLADRMSRASPESVGVDSDRLAQALDHLGTWVADGIVPGAGAVIARHGRIIAERYVGVTQEGGAQAIGPQTIYSLASVSKPFTATAVMRLVEQGAFSLSERVRHWFPEFRGENTVNITVRQLLTHTAGFSENIDDKAVAAAISEMDWPMLLEATIHEKPTYPPGTRVHYSNTGYTLLGGLVERAGGMSFPEFMRTQVFEPLGLKDTFVGPPAAALDVVARSAIVAGINPTVATYGSFDSEAYRAKGYPFAGIVAGLRDLVTFAQVFLAGGRDPVTGVHFLSPVTAKAMITNQTDDLPGGVSGYLSWPRCPWGYGWEIKADKFPHWLGEMVGPHTFLHVGQSGTMLWADPAVDLVCACAANRALTRGWFQPRWWRFTNAVMGSIIQIP